MDESEDSPSVEENNFTQLKRETIIALYTAKLFLPGFMDRQAFLIINFILPLLDFGLDWYHSGVVFII